MLTSLLALAAIAPAQTATPRFAETVLSDFAAWDADRDGALSPIEIERSALDSRFRGPDAAALAALHVWLAATKESTPRLDRAWFQAYRPVRLVIPKGTAPAEATRLRRAYASTPGSLGSTFTRGVRQLASFGEPVLYSGRGPVLTDIRQGALGDCYMLAPLGAMVHRDPEAVRGMIRPVLDGSKQGYEVRFGDGKEVRVGALTDAERAMGGASTEGGLWIRVIEKAFGSRDLPADAVEVSRDGMSGGHLGPAGRAFAGHAFTSIPLVGDFRKEVNDADLAKRLERLRTEIPAALAERRLVLAGSPEREMPRSINGKHAYAIFGYDAATDQITLWNPHGNDFDPKGEESPENGYTRKNGVFTIPLTLFARAFSRVYFERKA